MSVKAKKFSLGVLLFFNTNKLLNIDLRLLYDALFHYTDNIQTSENHKMKNDGNVVLILGTWEA